MIACVQGHGSPSPKRKRAGAALLATALAMSLFGSCSSRVAELMTDRPELALYASAFNASQTRYRIIVRHEERLGQAIESVRKKPALAVGRYLKSAPVRKHLQSLDYLFGELSLNQSSFIPNLLSLGNVDGRQVLLPVSFNIPLVTFKDEGAVPLPEGFVVSLGDIEPAASAFNRRRGETFTAMGYSPRWDPEFLALLARVSGAQFREGSPLSWSDEGLDRALATARDWSNRVNGSAALEDEFQFKYLYLPPYASVASGRSQFAILRSDRYFLIPEEMRGSLDFRWYGENGQAPVLEDVVYAGICRTGAGKQAAEAFLGWLFAEETQKTLLERAKRFRLNETVFGLAGGFSSIGVVNERWFPASYPGLVGHIPPAAYLEAPSILPRDWEDIRAKVLIPFLTQAAGQTPPEDTRVDFRSRLAAWSAEGR